MNRAFFNIYCIDTQGQKTQDNIREMLMKTGKIQLTVYTTTVSVVLKTRDTVIKTIQQMNEFCVTYYTT